MAGWSVEARGAGLANVMAKAKSLCLVARGILSRTNASAWGSKRPFLPLAVSGGIGQMLCRLSKPSK